MSRFPDLPPLPEPWQPQFDAHIGHVMTCKSCYAPTARYCSLGAELWREYERAVITSRPD